MLCELILLESEEEVMIYLMLLLTLARGLSGARAEFICAGAVTPQQPIRVAKPARTVQEGTRRALVIFARFRDEEGGWREIPAWGQDLFAAEKPGGFSHFYDTMSFGRLQVRGEVAPRLYASAQPAAAYLAEGPATAGRFGQFVREILAQVDQEVDFARFDDDGPDGAPDSGDDDGYADAIFLLLAAVPPRFLIGPATGTGNLGFEGAFTTGDRGITGAPIRLAGELGTIQQGPSFAEAVGAMCHEYGHVLGLPDLYEVEFLSSPGAPPTEDSAGIGAWGLMGWGALGWQGNDGPNSFCAWSRAQLGWSEVVVVDQQTQEVRLEEVGRGGKIVAVPLTDQERFLLEYRRRDGNYYDRHLPGEGLLIWHVGGKEGNAVDLECADGRYLDAGYPRGQQPDSRRGGDNLDFWAHDTRYTEEHAGNLGDATDPFDGVRHQEFTPQTNPAASSREGTVSVRIVDMHLEGSTFAARVELPPPRVEVTALRLEDASQDGVLMEGEEVRVRFELINRGWRSLPELRVALVSQDAQVEILSPDLRLDGLRPGERVADPGTLRFRFVGPLQGTPTASLALEVSAGGALFARHEFAAVGVAARQVVRRVVVIDSLGNGDGGVQAGEQFQLRVELDAAQPELLRSFHFFLRSLDPQVQPLGEATVAVGASGKVRIPEFYLSPAAEAGAELRFVWESVLGAEVWRDTLVVVVQEGRLAPLFTRVETVLLPATFAPLAFADIDGDGWPDLLGVDQSAYPGRLVLFHNEGKGAFRRQEGALPQLSFAESGVAAFGDWDRDGDPDLFVAGKNSPDRLLRNDTGHFVEVRAGLAGAGTQGAIWWDYDRDGWLDLYLGRPVRGVLCRNAAGALVEVTARAGLDQDFYPLPQHPFPGMAAADFDGDGWSDLYLPVMKGANRLLRNDRRGGFLDITNSEVGDSGKALGVAVGDIDNDGDLDIFQPAGDGSPVPLVEQSRSLLLLNLGKGQFLDITDGVGLGPRLDLARARLLDLDADGDLDLLGGTPFALFLNEGSGLFVERTFKAGLPGFGAVADCDGDGFLDVGAAAGLFRNSGNRHHWLQIELAGVGSNRDGLGAWLIARTGTLAQTRELFAGDGLTQDEGGVYFGLGEYPRVDELEVRWPSGRVEVLSQIPADQRIRLIEGHGTWYPARRAGWTVAPPAAVAFGQEVSLRAEVQAPLFEPGARIIRATADLNSLGGPEAMPLQETGAQTYRLEARFVVSGTGGQGTVEVLVEQETALGPRWMRLSREVAVTGYPATAVVEEEHPASLPQAFSLSQNYPNPFNSDTVIRFALPESGEVELAVYNLAGQQVVKLVQGQREAGTYSMRWDGRDGRGRELASGVYLYRLRAGERVQTRKLLLLQ